MSVYENGEHKPYESESKSLWNIRYAEDDLRKDSGLIFTSAWNDFDYQKKDN